MDSLSSGLGSLLLDGKYTDLEIKCGDKSFKVHRAVVCNKSAVLAKQCDLVSELHPPAVRVILTCSTGRGSPCP